ISGIASAAARQDTLPDDNQPAASNGQLPTSHMRPASISYSGVSPLTTASQSSTPSTPSPATDSPQGSRSMRLPGIGMGAPGASGATATRLMKQPGLHRPPSIGSLSSVAAAQKSTSQQANGSGALTSVPEGPVQNKNLGPLHPSLEGIELGDRVLVDSMGLSGYLRFAGTTGFKPGVWVGVELDTPIGKNDGSVSG
ncbi:Kinesin protein 1B, partial [Mortierella sp. GBA43]